MARRSNGAIRTDVETKMQRIVLLIFIACLSLVSFSESPKTPAKESSVVYVYISASKSAKCYHASPKCQALRKSRKVIKIDLKEAQKSKKACKHCYYPSSPLPKREYLEDPY